MMLSMSDGRINIIVENSHDYEKNGRETNFIQQISFHFITTNTGLLPIQTMHLYTVLEAHTNLEVRRTTNKITGTISEMSKYGIN